MLTKCKLSTISYNTDSFLKEKLNELLNAKKIRFWCYMQHKPEDLELKDHKHLIIFPDKRIETSDLDDIFIEVDPTNDKPLRCIDWRTVKSIPDWFLYALHDTIYCRKKHKQEKVFHYTPKDFISSDKTILDQYLYEAYHEYDFWSTDKYMQMFENGISASDLVKNGYISMNEMVQYHYFVKSLSSE